MLNKVKFLRNKTPGAERSKMKKRKRVAYHSGYPIGSVKYIPKYFKRLGAFIRYTCVGNVIWLFKLDIDGYYAAKKKCEERKRP